MEQEHTPKKSTNSSNSTQQNKKSFLKKVFFVIPDVRLPRIRLRIPNWRTPGVNLTLPAVKGQKSLNLSIPSIRGLRIVGGVWKVGTFGLAVGLVVMTIAIMSAVRGLQAATIWPEPALYTASYVQPDSAVKVGQDWDQFMTDTTPAETRQLQTMTLQLNLSGARAGDITLSGLDIGKASGLTDALQIVGSSGNGHDLICDEVILDGLEAKTLNLGSSEIYVLNITNNIADGLSIGPTMSATPKDIVVQSIRGTVSVPAVTNSTYDRIIIDTSTADGFCRKLTISNVSAYGAGINLDNIHAGTLTIQNSIIGDGTGINAASFIVANTTKIQQLNATNNVEQPVSVQ